MSPTESHLLQPHRKDEDRRRKEKESEGPCDPGKLGLQVGSFLSVFELAGHSQGCPSSTPLTPPEHCNTPVVSRDREACQGATW